MTTIGPTTKQTQMFDSLWWCSHAAMRDSVESRAEMTELFPDGGTIRSRGLATPEEVTTYNWVRRLTQRRRSLDLPVAVVHHSRSLEGGRPKRAGSGADLEIAVQLRSGRWIDLLLQAKRLYESASGTGVYQGWKASQIRAMRRWARTHGGRATGMLLYNADIPPFEPLNTFVSQGACHTRQMQLVRDSAPPSGDHLSSPLGLTVVLFPGLPTNLPARLNHDGLSADVVNRDAFPFECLQAPVT
jgi:hypothetical protein